MAVYDIPFQRMDGTTTSLAEWRDDVMLVVNVASRCGLAPQYTTLEAMHEKYHDRGFTVLGFPSNQFLQELRTNEAVAEFCSTTYGVTFPVLDRVRLNGRHTHPLYAELKRTPDDLDRHEGRIRWNFEKFVVLPGAEVHRFAPRTLPDDPAVVGLIETHLPR
jgi:glutathione peroxidase